MSASNLLETALLQHIFQNAIVANMGNAGGLLPSSVAGSLYVSLHTANPDETGTVTTNEATYTGYGRIAIARTVGGWTVTGNAWSNAAIAAFAACTAGSNAITHFGIGSSASGVGDLFFKGALTATLTVSAGITPSFAIGALSGTLD